MIRDKLSNANESRTFQTKTLINSETQISVKNTIIASDKGFVQGISSLLLKFSQGTTRAPEHKLVRTDSKLRTLDGFLSSGLNRQNPESPCMILSYFHIQIINIFHLEPYLKAQKDIVDVRLTSVLDLRKQISDSCHDGYLCAWLIL